MLTTHTVEWSDPRVTELHAKLSAETGAMYRTRLAKLPRPEREAALGSLAIDPTVIETTLLTLDDDEPVATAAVRRSVASPNEWDVKRVFVVESHRGPRHLARVDGRARELRSCQRGDDDGAADRQPAGAAPSGSTPRSATSHVRPTRRTGSTPAN